MHNSIKVLAVITASLAGIASAEAATIPMPAGSTVWMKMNSSTTCWDGVTAGADDCVASTQPGPNPAKGIPSSSFTSGDNTTRTQAEILPDQIRGFLSGRSSQLTMSFQDTYTIHGAVAGPFDITVELNAEGIMRSLDSGLVGHPFRHAMIGTTVNAEIGNFNPETTDIPESFRVNPFPGSPDASKAFFPASAAGPSPFSVPFDITASHTLLSLLVGDSFTLGFGVTLFASVGVVDMLNTGHISFVLPDGVFLTSALGGRFGEEVTSEVPLPGALPLFAGGLGVMGLLGWRRKQRNVAARAAA